MDVDRKISSGQVSVRSGHGGLPLMHYAPAGPLDVDALCCELHRSPKHQRQAVIGRTIETTILPRLLLYGAAAVPAAMADSGATSTAEVIRLTALVLANDIDAALDLLLTLGQAGLGFDRLCLDLLAPAARRLGELWDADACDFVAVTLGLMRLHRLLREVTPDPAGRLVHRDERHRLLLGMPAGEQHSFGLELVGEFFRQDGWMVRTEATATAAELTRMVRREWFALAGFSISGTERLEALAATILGIRRASANITIGILVGGPVFIGRPELVTRVGADAMATDGHQAVEQGHRLVSLLGDCR
jgi:methanogenic corrinoid protein MtbC1